MSTAEFIELYAYIIVIVSVICGVAGSCFGIWLRNRKGKKK